MANSGENFQQFIGRLSKKHCPDRSLPLIGKISLGEILEFSGSHLTGATSIFCNGVIEYLTKTESSVVYIDCERGVSPYKITQLLSATTPSSKVPSVLDRLLLANSHSIDSLISTLEFVHKCFQQNKNYVDIVFIDSLLAYHWSTTQDKHILKNKVLPLLQSIKPFCTVITSWHSPFKSNKPPDDLTSFAWTKLITRRYQLSNQSNPRLMVEETSGKVTMFNVNSVNGVVEFGMIS